VDVRDVAEALIALAGAARPGMTAFNVGTGIGMSVADVVRTCSRIAGRPLSVRPDPPRLRNVDRLSLVADPATTRSRVGWEARRTLSQTLRELVTDMSASEGVALAQ
jgi:UDP-glucose 4-epimerase